MLFPKVQNAEVIDQEPRPKWPRT